MYVPFIIRDPSGEPLPAGDSIGGEKTARINKVWSGLAKECCSDADNFQVLFPKEATTVDKANLIGANILIDFTFFESQS